MVKFVIELNGCILLCATYNRREGKKKKRRTSCVIRTEKGGRVDWKEEIKRTAEEQMQEKAYEEYIKQKGK